MCVDSMQGGIVLSLLMAGWAAGRTPTPGGGQCGPV